MASPKIEYVPIMAFVLDFETGGRECQTAAITQIAIHAIRLDTFEKVGSYVRYVYPYDYKETKATKKKTLKSKYDAELKIPMQYEDEALTYSGIKMDTLYEVGVPIEQVAEDVLKFIQDCTPEKTSKNRKPIIVGQNIWFDEGFLSQMFERCGLTKELAKLVRGYTDYYGNWHPHVVDTIHMGQLALSHNPAINSFKLELMCEQVGIELDDAHDADADVAATTNLLGELTKRMRSVGGSVDGVEIQTNKAEKSRKHFKI